MLDVLGWARRELEILRNHIVHLDVDGSGKSIDSQLLPQASDPSIPKTQLGPVLARQGRTARIDVSLGPAHNQARFRLYDHHSRNCPREGGLSACLDKVAAVALDPEGNSGRLLEGI